MDCRILVLEDDRDDALLLKRALMAAAKRKAIALSVEHAVNGFEGISNVGLNELLSRLPNAVVVDLNMPFMDGMAFLRSLRRTFELKTLPTVVLTTSDEQEIHNEAFEAGADQVFAKPGTYDELVTIAEHILSTAIRGVPARPIL